MMRRFSDDDGFPERYEVTIDLELENGSSKTHKCYDLNPYAGWCRACDPDVRHKSVFLQTQFGHYNSKNYF
jgi:hypothetical protein